MQCCSFFKMYCKNFLLLILTFGLYSCAVLFGLNSFTGVFNKMYLIHFGNPIVIAIMLEMNNNILKWLVPISGFGAYALVRIQSQTLQYVAALGAFNVFEQLLGYFIVKQIKDPVTSFGFVSKLFVCSTLLSAAFALPGSYVASYLNSSKWSDSFTVYFLSHILGTYLGLYYYKIFRYIEIKLPIVFIRDYLIVIILVILCNSFKEYENFGLMALIGAYPLLAILAATYNQICAGITDISITIIVFTLTSLARGSFWYIKQANGVLSVVIGMYAFIITSSLLSAYVSIGMQNLRDSLNETVMIKNDIAFIFSQVSHDIRSPIMQIQDILQRVNINSYTKNDLDDAIEECDILINLMESWLMALHSSPNKESRNLFVLHEKPTNLNKIISFLHKRTNKYIDSNDKIKFIVEYNNYNKFVILDPLYLIQIVFNLLTNSIKCTDNGYVKLNINVIEDKKIIIKVSDTGCGIEPTRVNKLFNEFKSTHTNVTENTNYIPTSSHGVGLMIVKKFTDLMNGSITVDSVINEGTTFTLEIPISVTNDNIDIENYSTNNNTNNIIQYVNSITPNNFSLVNIRICIAEDEKICTALIKRMLTGCDNKVFVKDGNKVIEMLIYEGPFDILCLDGSLPNKNAEDIISELISMRRTHTKELSKLKILITSGRELSIDLSTIPFPVMYCCKPFSQNVLLTKIETIINNNKNTILI